MQLKLTLQRGRGRTDVDLSVVVDPDTTVGALAEHFAASDPESPAHVSGTLTLAFADAGAKALAPNTSVSDAGIHSGSRLLLTEQAIRTTESVHVVAVVIAVVAGPDVGKEFSLPPGTSIIGRGRECDIRLDDPMMSRRHAKIHVADSVEISDLGSANGVLIGDSPAELAILQPGDSALLGDTVITVKSKSAVGFEGGSDKDVMFNRSPRLNVPFVGKSFPLPDPPQVPRGQRFPIIPLFAPLLMGAALYLSTRSTTSLIFMAMSPLMMGGNVLENQLAGKKSYRQSVENFREAVANTRAEIVASIETEKTVRCSEEPSVSECAEAVVGRNPLLWSRRPELPGFGQLRLGLGPQPSRSKLEFPFGRQAEVELTVELHEAFDSLGVIDGVPIIAKFDEGGALGVAGSRRSGRGAARAYLTQITSLHSPTELAVYSMCGPDRASDWEWLKWLPHCGGTQAPLTCEPLVSAWSDCAALLSELDALIRARTEAGRTSGESLPRVLLVVDDPIDTACSRLIDLVERGKACGVWTMWMADELTEIPACCTTFVTVSEDDGQSVAGFIETSEAIEPLSIETLALAMAEDLARKMSPIVDVSSRDESQSDVPRSVSLLSLLGRDLADVPERVVERWTENRSVLTGPFAARAQGNGRPGNLRALLGESAAGPHVLDLRSHGPHALVGGTTGAGKSELLQSWIIGMAVSNSPQRLTFLLVDYKGGSAFSDCVNLPHTVGLVTDLSPHLVRRALTSLSAELRYREHILHRKRAKDLASLERDADPEAPPSLVIVVDEFAALVKEVPEFVDGVVNVAQRGRSLGLHLILATQRPSGVIRDNLRANTNLRIALRMADVADSTDVIGTKAAAGFDPSIPGRAASRTGPTALVPFQTGYVGGWTSAVPDRPEIVVTSFGFAPKTTWVLPVQDDQSQPVEGPTDIQRLVASVGKANQIAEIEAPRKPWLAELAPVYNLAMLSSSRRDEDLVFAVGDDPARQLQPTVSFRPDDDGNMAIFGTGNSGKSTLLRTICLSAGITVRGGPCHVYGLDFAARGLQMLEKLPHVGTIIPGTDIDRVARLLIMLREVIDARASEYADVGAGSIVQFRQITGRSDEPRILLLVDGMGGMRTAFEGTEHHRLFEAFIAIAADGRQVGVHLILAADRAGAVPSSLGSLIQRRVVLRMANDNDYSMLGQPSDVLNPKSPPGRGMCDGIEIQVAVLGGSSDLLDQDVAVTSFASAMRRAGASIAPEIRTLDEEVYLEDLAPQALGRPTFALAADTLSEKGLVPSGTFTVAGPPGSGRTTAMKTIASCIRRWQPDTRLLFFGSKRSDLVGALNWDWSALDIAEAVTLAEKAEQYLGEAVDGAPPGVVVIENLTDYLQTAADLPLQDMIKRVTANGHLVVSDGEPVPLSGLQQLVQAARASRVGLVLQPEQTDGVLFRTQFPRVRKSDFPPGRALYVGRGDQPVVVQVALPGSSPH